MPRNFVRLAFVQVALERGKPMPHQAVEEVMRMLRQLNQEGSTIVMVTHSPSHADFASRVVNMLDGRILQERRRAA